MWPASEAEGVTNNYLFHYTELQEFLQKMSPLLPKRILE